MSRKIRRQLALWKFIKEAGEEGRTNKQIENYLEGEHTFSTSTLSNDIRELKESGWKIDDETKGVYKLIDEDNDYSEFQSHFIKFRSMAIAYERVMSFDVNVMQYVLFEPNSVEFKLVVFEKMFEAIRNRKAVTFNHTKFKQGSEGKEYYFEPYVLKEYQGRWYAIGKTKKGYRTFSLDRIFDIKITNDNVKIDLYSIQLQLGYVVGVSFNEDIIERKIVKLKIDNSQKEYIKTTPIFKRQEIIEENDTHFILELTVGNTVELRQQILKYGRRIEVLEPEELRQQIFEEIKDLYKMYE